MRMRKLTAVLLGTVLVCAMAATSLAAESYEIDPAHSAIIFGCKHAGASYTRGMFRKVKGTFTYDQANAEGNSVEIVVAASSIFSNDKKRDQHLKSPDFLNARQFPKIHFKSTKITKSGDIFNVAGDLKLHGVTKSVTVPMAHVGAGKGPYGKFRRGFEGKLTIKRSDYGMSKMLGPVGDEVELIFSIEGIRK